jgi:protease FtsH subunit HflC
MNKIILALVALVVAILLLSSSLFVVDQRQFAAVFGLGQIKRVISTPGCISRFRRLSRMWCFSTSAS